MVRVRYLCAVYFNWECKLRKHKVTADIKFAQRQTVLSTINNLASDGVSMKTAKQFVNDFSCMLKQKGASENRREYGENKCKWESYQWFGKMLGVGKLSYADEKQKSSNPFGLPNMNM